jgi:hypothetical protein
MLCKYALDCGVFAVGRVAFAAAQTGDPSETFLRPAVIGLTILAMVCAV